jgi:flagellar biosynthetic protein FliQ
MTPEQVVQLARQTVEAAFWVAAPVLLSAVVIGLIINIGQVLTSIQDTTVSTVPRLTAVGVILFVLAPWILNHLLVFTRTLFGDFRLYTH